MIEKKSLVLSFLVLMAVSVGAYTIGQIVTQQQVDNTDFSSHGMDFAIESISKNTEYVEVLVSYTTLDKLETGDYEIVSRIKDTRCYMEGYYRCRSDGNDKATCVQRCKYEMVSEVKAFRNAERVRLQEYQTLYYDEITAEDFRITAQDLE